MSQTSYSDLQRSLRSEGTGGVFFLFGDEAFLRERAVDEIVAAHLDPATRDFNLDQVRGADVAAETLASLVATPPLMAAWRVVVVREAQGLANRAREAIERIAVDPPPGLVLVVSAAIPTGSKAKFYSELQRRATSVEFAAVSPHDAPGWLIEQAREAHGLELPAEAARLLVAGLGADLGILASELAKLAAYAADRRVVGVDDVRAVAGSLPHQDRWAWFELIGERRFDEALRTLPLLLQAGESGVGLLIGAGTHLLRLAILVAGGQAALERELKPYQRWLARKMVPHARRWTLAELDGALAELARTDRLLKSASLNDRQAVEELLLRLAHAPATTARVA